MLFTMQGIETGCRFGPQVLGHQGSRMVVDWSMAPRQWDDAHKVYAVPLDRVFVEPNSAVIVIGAPNAAIALPREDGSGWDRFNAFMARRKPTFVADSRGMMQAGVWFEILNPPTGALEALRLACQSLVGSKGISCARLVARALTLAGFRTSKGKPFAGRGLGGIVRPSQLAAMLWRDDITYQGQPVHLRVIQTGEAVADHMYRTWLRERDSPRRLLRKQYSGEDVKRAPLPAFEPKSESMPFDNGVFEQPGQRVLVAISVPSPTGVNLGYLFGSQPEFLVPLPVKIPPSVELPILPPYPGKLSFTTKFKKWVLFNKGTIWLLGKIIAEHWEGIDGLPAPAAVQMLRRSPTPARHEASVYNFVLTTTDLKLKRLQNDNGRDNQFVNWVLAKHVLLARYAEDVVLAGELWCCEEDGVMTVYIRPESGTYKPLQSATVIAGNSLSVMFGTTVRITHS